MALMMKCILLHHKGRMGTESPGSNINYPLTLNNSKKFVTRKVNCYDSSGSAKNRSWMFGNHSLTGSPSESPPAVMKALMPVDRSPPPPNSLTVKEGQQGLGIVELLEGKSLFITGSTGFLAKALVESILRTVPNVDKIYVLMRANNQDAAAVRLKNDIINADLFKSLQERHGESYEPFMLSKLVPIAGNVCEINLGLDEDSAAMIAEKIDIIVNSAAATSFIERYDVAINTNTRGPLHVLAFAKKCKNLQLFLHVSTAYVTRQSKGLVKEKLLKKGSNITSNEAPEAVFSFLPNDLDIEGEITLALSSSKQVAEDKNNHSTISKLKELGLQRARKYGWYNTYSLTKAMGETLLNNNKGDIPLVIVRPTIIEGSIRDPFPGWIEGNRMIDPIATLYGKGIIPGFIGDPNTIVDMIPVDMVVNAMLAIMAKQIQRLQQEKKRMMTITTVYHLGSSATNPLTFGSCVNMFYKHYNENPLLDSKGDLIHVTPFKLFDSIEDLDAEVWTHLTKSQQHIPASPTRPMDTCTIKDDSPTSKKHKLYKRFAEEINNYAHMYEPYAFYYGRFDNSNTQSIIHSMSDEERRIFSFDTKGIDWEDYYLNVHSPGLRKHVIKDKRD